ncbi:MAG: NUDIX hydrolase [Actinobacteria bacterium]|nr:NUDIX hydrolase [Actinomycetota bacterium]
MSRSKTPIRAAGVVLLRQVKGKTEVCVLHRPSHKDWSLPKGKVEVGEHVVTAAYRETLEETGEFCRFGVPLATASYRVDGRKKTVRYWVAWVVPGGPGFAPNSEIDDLEWLSPDKAAKRLTYPRDVQLMRAALAAPATAPLVILRHTQARRRASWGKKPDRQRPLAAIGQRHAKDLVPILTAFGADELYSSDAVRCINTVTPFADQRKSSIAREPLFSEDGFDDGKSGSFKRLDQLLAIDEPMVLCTHRPLLPELLKHLQRKIGLAKTKHLDPSLPPGGFIVLHRQFHPKRGLRITAIERHEP